MDDGPLGEFYQIVCSCSPRSWMGAVDWLASQVGYQFDTGEVIEHIDQFQFVPIGPDGPYRAVATCSVFRPQEEE